MKNDGITRNWIAIDTTQQVFNEEVNKLLVLKLNDTFLLEYLFNEYKDNQSTISFQWLQRFGFDTIEEWGIEYFRYWKVDFNGNRLKTNYQI